LITAEARQGILRPHTLPQPLRHLDEELVPGGMPQAIVDHLETVEIEEEDGEVLVAPGGAREGMVETVEQEGTVWQPGEGIVECLVPQLGLIGLALANIAHDDTEKQPPTRRQARRADLDVN